MSKAKIVKNPGRTMYFNFVKSTDQPKRPYIWMQGDQQQFLELKKVFEFFQSNNIALPSKIKGFHRWAENIETENSFCIYQENGVWKPFDVKMNFPTCYFYTQKQNIERKDYWQCTNGVWKHICPAIQKLQKINKDLQKQILGKKVWKDICHLIHPDKIKYQINPSYLQLFKQTQRLLLQSDKDDSQSGGKLHQSIKAWLEINAKIIQQKQMNNG